MILAIMSNIEIACGEALTPGEAVRLPETWQHRSIAAVPPLVIAKQMATNEIKSIAMLVMGKVCARLFAATSEPLQEAELTDQRGDEKYEAKGRNCGSRRSGKSSLIFSFRAQRL